MKLLVYIDKDESEDLSKSIENCSICESLQPVCYDNKYAYRIGFLESIYKDIAYIALKDEIVNIDYKYIKPIDYYDGFTSVNLERIKQKTTKDLKW